VSAGCDNCYALTLAKRLKAMGSAKYQKDGDPRTSGQGFGLTVHPDALQIPYGWKSPRTVFVNSMSDLFHARVPLDFVRQVFEVIADTPQHTYQVLTKRARRLRQVADRLEWPANLWMGVSVEGEKELARVDDLRQVLAAVRFLSCEPLLGPLKGLDVSGIDWVIAGGESGPRFRPLEPEWVTGIRDVCQEADVPFFFELLCTTDPDRQNSPRFRFGRGKRLDGSSAGAAGALRNRQGPAGRSPPPPSPRRAASERFRACRRPYRRRRVAGVRSHHWHDPGRG
jgi:protein gp37